MLSTAFDPVHRELKQATASTSLSKKIAAYVRYIFLCISLPSSAKQQREMTKFWAVYGTWTMTANFSHLYLEFRCTFNLSKLLEPLVY